MTKTLTNIVRPASLILLGLIIGMGTQFIHFNAPASKQNSGESKSICDEILKNQQQEPAIKYDEKPAPVNFSKFPEAKQFKTVINKFAALGPNYAGHFTFISWGCGTSCFQYAITDSKTGDMVTFSNSGTEFLVYPPKFSLSSRTLIFNAKESLSFPEGLTTQNLIEKYGHEIGSERAYFYLHEGEGGNVWLEKLCSENILDGL